MEIDPYEKDMILTNSYETIVMKQLTCRDSDECEFWDKYLQPLRNVESQDYNF